MALLDSSSSPTFRDTQLNVCECTRLRCCTSHSGGYACLSLTVVRWNFAEQNSGHWHVSLHWAFVPTDQHPCRARVESGANDMQNGASAVASCVHKTQKWDPQYGWTHRAPVLVSVSQPPYAPVGGGVARALRTLVGLGVREAPEVLEGSQWIRVAFDGVAERDWKHASWALPCLTAYLRVSERQNVAPCLAYCHGDVLGIGAKSRPGNGDGCSAGPCNIQKNIQTQWRLFTPHSIHLILPIKGMSKAPKRPDLDQMHSFVCFRFFFFFLF